MEAIKAALREEVDGRRRADTDVPSPAEARFPTALTHGMINLGSGEVSEDCLDNGKVVFVVMDGADDSTSLSTSAVTTFPS